MIKQILDYFFANIEREYNIGVSLYYRPTLLSDELLVQILQLGSTIITPITIDDVIPFNLDYIKNYTLDKLSTKPIHLDGKIMNSNFVEFVWVSDCRDRNDNYIQITMKFPMDSRKLLLVEEFLTIPGLIAGFVYDFQYIGEQSERDISAFKQLMGVKIIKDKWGQKWIDISNNPGRNVWTEDFCYRGASQIWFGPEFFKKYSKEKLLAFSGAFEISEIRNDFVCIHLYEGIFNRVNASK